jgi:hypothetical protein
MIPRALRNTLTDLSKRYIRYVLGFGVTTAVGLAPFLGRVGVPGFSSLLGLVPYQLQDDVVPLAAFLMGLVAVALEYYAGEEITSGRIRLLFPAGLAALLVGVVLFTFFSEAFVAKAQSGSLKVAVIVAAARRSECKCDKAISDEKCIQEVTLAGLASCWDAAALLPRKLALSFTYLFLTGGFGALIALLIIVERLRRRPPSAASPPASAGRGGGARSQTSRRPPGKRRRRPT